MAMNGDCGNTTNMTMESTMTTSASNRNDSSMWQPYERGNWPNGVLVLSTKLNPWLCLPADETRSLTQWCVSNIKQTESTRMFPSWSDQANASVVCWYPQTVNHTIRQAYIHTYIHTINQVCRESMVESSNHIYSQACIRSVNYAYDQSTSRSYMNVTAIVYNIASSHSCSHTCACTYAIIQRSSICL